MPGSENGIPVRVDHETYKRLRLLARASERSITRTVRILVMRAKPEDLGAVVVQEDAPTAAQRDEQQREDAV